MTEADAGPMYEPFAEQFDEHAHNSAYNAHYDRPAMLDLIGDVSGCDVLDAGCGPGYYAEALVERGARVTAFDASPTMVDLTKKRMGDLAGAGWDIRFWRQPLEAWCREFADAGFLIERLIEPRPAESMRFSDPETYEKLCNAPAFIAFRLVAA